MPPYVTEDPEFRLEFYASFLTVFHVRHLVVHMKRYENSKRETKNSESGSDLKYTFSNWILIRVLLMCEGCMALLRCRCFQFTKKSPSIRRSLNERLFGKNPSSVDYRKKDISYYQIHVCADVLKLLFTEKIHGFVLVHLLVLILSLIGYI